MSNITQISDRKRKGADTMDANRKGGDGGSGLEARIEKLESDVNQIKLELMKLTTRSEEFVTKGDLHKEFNAQTRWLATTMIGIAAASLVTARYIFS